MSFSAIPSFAAPYRSEPRVGTEKGPIANIYSFGHLTHEPPTRPCKALANDQNPGYRTS